jgi:hypothetical protein
MTFGHHAIHGADVMRIDREGVVHDHLLQRNVVDFSGLFPMGGRWHPLGKRGQHRRGAPQRVTLQRFTSGEHQHDDGARQIFSQNNGGDDGNATQKIGTEFPFEDLPQQVVKQRQSPEYERNQQGNLIGSSRRMESIAKPQMRQDIRRVLSQGGQGGVGPHDARDARGFPADAL